jgi:MGT family glycosyltransferase
MTTITSNDTDKFIRKLRPGTKVLFANFPADGHFNPLTGLAVHLKSIGCDVRWYTSKKYEEKITRLNIPFYGLKKALDISSSPDLEKVFPKRRRHKSQISKLVFDIINAFILRSPEYYEDLKGIYKEFSFDVLICDIAFGAIPFVKDKLQKPVIGISVFPLIETSKDLAPNGLAITPSNTFFGKLKQKFLHIVANKVLFAKPNMVMKKMLTEHGIDGGNSGVFDLLIRKSTLVLQSGTPSFEYKRSDLGSNIRFVGPLLPYSKKRSGNNWYNEKLQQYNKVILVTQGTVERDVKKIIIPTLEAFKNSDILVIATTGGSQTEELRKRYPYQNIIIEDFIPFDDVMPYADVYVSNGGYGGVLLAIRNHLPMVVAGVHEGKNEINARVGYFNLGINLKTEKPSIEQIRKGASEVLNNKVYLNNVRKLNEEFNNYNPEQLVTDYLAQVVTHSPTGPKVNAYTYQL